MSIKLQNLKQTIKNANEAFDSNYNIQITQLKSRLTSFQSQVQEIDLKIRNQTANRYTILHDTQLDFTQQFTILFEQHKLKLQSISTFQQDKLNQLKTRANDVSKRIIAEQENRSAAIEVFKSQTQEKIENLLNILKEIEAEDIAKSEELTIDFIKQNQKILKQLETRRKEGDDSVQDMKKEIDSLFVSRLKDLSELKTRISESRREAEIQINNNQQERILHETKLVTSLDAILNKMQCTLSAGRNVFD
ncbi:hypothetical protein SS50377_22350 [Spironucleus salmonicida]|uniref:SF-assemblin n=1 Tax=Spironucleus salmonicida TaxID=348837 RepID=V6LCE0_9EUKA|nr:hypothetical protein SS50377_22350 [Spironucleus salmonicida]|eukprot:EST42155.1 Hypothetical protein SS50377_18462 [Spironucleus salmonicida]